MNILDFGNCKKHGKSTVQVVLRWLIQRGIIVIPKTWNVVHLKENISILDFELSVDEMADITSLNKGKCLNYNSFVAQRGLPKNIEIGKGLKILIILRICSTIFQHGGNGYQFIDNIFLIIEDCTDSR